MQRTTTYKLPQWEKSDRIVMEDFNDQAAKLEAALTAHTTAIATKADQAAVSSLQTQVSQKADKSVTDALQTQVNGKSTFRCGAYYGNNAAGRQIEIGLSAQFAMVFCTGGSGSDSEWYAERAFFHAGGMLYQSSPASGACSIQKDMRISGTKLVLSSSSSWYLNKSNRSYFYIVF